MYVDYVNDYWIDLLTESYFGQNHIFIDWMKLMYDTSVVNPNAKQIKLKMPKQTKCNEFITGVITPQEVYSANFLSKYRSEAADWQTIKLRIDELSNMLIYPTSTLAMESVKDSVNILVLGSSLTAWYLVNVLKNVDYPKANILLVDDNVIPHGIYRKPFDSDDTIIIIPSLISVALPKIYAVNELHGKRIRVRYLEYLFMIAAYSDDIKVCYSKELSDLSKLQAFVKKNQISIVYDCTNNKYDGSYLPKDALPIEGYHMSYDVFSVIKHDNEYVLKRSDGISSRFYLKLFSLDKNYILHSIGTKNLINIKYLADLNVLKQLHNKCFTVPDIVSFVEQFDHLTDLTLSKIIQAELLSNANAKFRFEIHDACLTHKIKVANKIDDCIYIAAGKSAMTGMLNEDLFLAFEFLAQIVWHQQTLAKV